MKYEDLINELKEKQKTLTSIQNQIKSKEYAIKSIKYDRDTECTLEVTNYEHCEDSDGEFVIDHCLDRITLDKNFVIEILTKHLNELKEKEAQLIEEMNNYKLVKE